ncbi:Cysteine-rich motor neuron 1 protein [Desmophyllum pertusum]|uniref:Cysteine-rich motor neuron 1 protein n=1 Tax=Desmophyllum pertusum TaxID=174260 RepID=A0A9W9ZT86_9CNID|nr:Cysteine-rich motor neuron 1 protein [Desmophyllum pertusum]
MGKEARNMLVFINIVIFVYTTVCLYDGTSYAVGDEWKPNPLTSCRCAPPFGILECSSIFIPVCADHEGARREPGDRWLEHPTKNCTCNKYNFVRCDRLDEPVCMDVSGNLRKYRETWMNGSCVDCACVNGSINCTRYNVNISYGLYHVELLPTCEQCDIPLRASGT